MHRCPQKGRHATGTRRLEKLSPSEQTIFRLDTVRSIGLRDLDGKYKLKLCDMMVQSSVQTPRTGTEKSSYPRFESHDGRSNSDDRQMSRYEDANWFKENPNRAAGRNVSRTGTTCEDYCPYIKGISVSDWAVSNRPAVGAIVFISPDRLVRDTRDKDTTWIRLTYLLFHNCQVWWIEMSSSKMMPDVDRPRAVDMDLTQPTETFLRHVLEAHFDKLYDLPENIQDIMGLQALRPSAQSYDSTE